MWKLLLVASLFGFSVHADKEATMREQEIASQGDEPNAVTPTSDSCLSENTVKNYEKKSRPGIEQVKKDAKSFENYGKGVSNIRAALSAANLIPVGKNLGLNPREAGSLLSDLGFVNLLNCPAWKKKLGNGQTDAVPQGAVLVYDGDIRMKTPEGCLGEGPKPLTNDEAKGATAEIKKILESKAVDDHIRASKCGKTPGFKLIGIYVKNVN